MKNYLRRGWLFLRIVGRRWDIDYRMGIKTSWDVATIVWPKQQKVGR